jgi:vacuolar-type H+-ATPase subunit H
VLPDLAKIIAADKGGREKVAQAQQEALDLKNQTDSQVQESQAKLQKELTQVRQDVQTKIIHEADDRTKEIAAAMEGQVQQVTQNSQAHHDEAVAALVSRVLGT